MEPEIEIFMYEDVDLNNAMLIDGFPTVGLVSTIVASYIVDALKLQRVGAIMSREFPAASVVVGGVPSPPMRIYAGPKVCGPNNECDQVVVLTSEFSVPNELQLPLARAILNWSKEMGVKLIVSLEGTALEKEPASDEDLVVFGAGSTDHSRKIVDNFNMEHMQTGIIMGVSGHLLNLANMEGVEMLCLLAPAHLEFPDARAAARLIEVIDDMLPVVEIDTSPLLEEASKIEENIQGAIQMMRKNIETGVKGESLPASPMYR
jgi:uncharacterized protein